MHEEAKSKFAAIVDIEPWRQRVGYPTSVMDPMWDPKEHTECDGEIVFEKGTRYWNCKSCGYIGWATTQKHYPILAPKSFLSWCREFFLKQRAEQGLSPSESNDQLMYVTALAMRFAAMKRPEELRDFVEKMGRL